MTDGPAPVVDLALARPPLLGRSRLVCIDGPAGSGKTTLADAVVAECMRRALGVALVHMDDVYEGWGGLATAGERLHRTVIEPLSRGEEGSCPRYDWEREEYGEQLPVPPEDVVVVEGVGSASRCYADRVSVLVFVEAPEPTRLRRGLARDGAGLQPQWRRWAAEEAQHHRAERTRSRADVLADGETGRLSLVRRAHA